MAGRLPALSAGSVCLPFVYLVRLICLAGQPVLPGLAVLSCPAARSAGEREAVVFNEVVPVRFPLLVCRSTSLFRPCPVGLVGLIGLVALMVCLVCPMPRPLSRWVR